jgi:hypothetical protein
LSGLKQARSRRNAMKLGFGAAALALVSSGPAQALLAPSPHPDPSGASRGIRPDLLRAALAALDRHQGRIPQRDRIAIADFAAPSSQPRFHLLNLQDGTSETLLVAHGSGSDPDHSGWLSRFSNDPGSNASCEGAFLASDYYVGKHGQSQRLLGLDVTNDMALNRAIVIHSAWYAEPEMLITHGQLGRSQGCFAVGPSDLKRVFERLGPDRMLFSAKV